MSLEELLEDTENSTVWKKQKRKLIRVVLGVFVLSLSLVGGSVYFLSLKQKKVSESAIADKQREQQVELLKQLMSLKNEADTLKNEVDQARSVASVRDENGSKQGQRASPNMLGRARATNWTHSKQIINYEPGDGFEKMDKHQVDIYIPTGAIFRAQLMTPIKTSVQRTFVIAETTNEFRMDMKRRIPKGSRLIGNSRLNPVLKGVIVEFTKLVLPNGIETDLNALALSRNALPEIDGLYFSDDLQNYGTALAFGFLSGFSDAARVREPTVLGSLPEQSLSSQVLAGLSTASFQVAEEILRDIRSRAIEYVVVPAGEPVFVALTRRYDLKQGEQK